MACGYAKYTGKLGVCAAGVMACSNGSPVCEQVTQAGTEAGPLVSRDVFTAR